MKCIVLCADDYGQNPAISQAIIDLIDKKRLSATSCMVNSDGWLTQAKWLEPYKNQVDIGLHINFTDGNALSPEFIRHHGAKMPSLSKLLIKSYLHQLNRKAVMAEVNAQLDQFVKVMDQLPDFLDGHQHVHQFPVLRDVILEVYETRLRENNSYIRNTSDPAVWFRYREDAYFKKIIIQMTGAAALKSLLEIKKIPHNSSFSGVYDFVNGKDYAKKFPEFLSQITNNGLIMCHPGQSNNSDSDPIYISRPYENQYLASEQILEDCKRADVVISRLEKIVYIKNKF